jgi:hypothetical protein
MPFQSAPTPSSRATVIIVPIMPLYLGGPVADACSCSRTFAVSMGMVHASAKEAEKALAARLLTKLLRCCAAARGDMTPEATSARRSVRRRDDRAGRRARRGEV